MSATLNEAEVRVLGSLVEKQVTTPEYYPLTLNALVQACNQKSNRSPVVSYDEATVERAAESLRAKNLVYLFYGSTSRVPKYKHMMGEVYGLSPRELAVMCVLMLRGHQTPGELRGRTDRLYDFQSLQEVEETLDSLSAKEPEPLVVKLPRQPGQKEVRYAHLLSGEVTAEQFSVPEQAEAPHVTPRSDRLAALEQEVATLRGQLDALRQEFEEFKKQFD
ncbi:MAG TPA: YceH family protein [Pyrinomonadaceae bacterium]|nr:YceH family protein [Pyrinomonadaceae bacterium]